MATKIFSLDCEAESSALLWGLSSHEKSVKLVWSLNKMEEWGFNRSDDFEVIRNKKNFYFIHYEHVEFDFEHNYHLYKNQCNGAFLIPELKQINYFIHVKYVDEPPQKNISTLLNKPSEGQLCFKIDPDKLKPATRELFSI